MNFGKKIRTHLATVALLCGMLSLSACGGGGDDPAPATPTTNSVVGTWLIDTFDGVPPNHTLTLIFHDDSTFSFREGAPGDPDTFWCTYAGTYSNTNTTITYTDTAFDGNHAGCADDYSNGTPYNHSYTLNGNQLTETEGTFTAVSSKQAQTNYYEVYGATAGDYSYTTSNRTLIGTSITGNTFDITGFDRFTIHIPSTAGKVLFDAFGLDSQWVQSAPGAEFAHYTKAMTATDPSGSIDPDIEGAQDGKTIENVVGEDAYYHFTTFGASTLTVY